MTAKVPWRFGVAWRMPWTDLNKHIGLAGGEGEGLAYLLQCPTSTFEPLYEKALINSDLSLTELGGNSRLALALFSAHRRKHRFETN